ncbi:6-carboxyhexanoate--CoA ligase, partial [Romboutsia sp. 1001216sp1]
FKSIKNMRGAVLLDVNNLKRLEKDKLRGIRATYMDFEDLKIDRLDKQHEYTNNLNKNEKLLKNTHFIEALCLSSKVCNAPNIVGEICCSDDKNYTTGYIASKEFGYIRVKHMKDIGEDRGGRIFLYDPTKDFGYTLEDTIKYLENTKVIVKDKVIFK